jgi:hypothetical protein
MQPLSPPDRKTRIFILLVVMVIALAMMGSFFWPILKDLYQARQNGNHGSNVPLLVFGGFFLVVILAMVVSVVLAIRRSSNVSGAAVSRPADSQPWLARPDWAAGRVKSSAASGTKFFLLWSVLALAISAPAVLAIPKEWQKGNHLIVLVLMFPVVAFYLLGWLVVKWRAYRRFGECYFEMAAIPGAPGGTLEGLIQTGARLRLEHGLHLKLACIRRIVSGSGDNHNVVENILWQEEKIFKTEADLPEPEPGRSGIPVFFKLPADQPECSVYGGESVIWRLEAKAKMSGPDFAAQFEVPVFQVAGVAAAEAADAPDPTAPLQMPVEELRRDEHSKIQVTDGPAGREFYFPAARNPGAAIFTTVLFLAFSGGLGAMIAHHFSIVFELALGLFALLFGCFTFVLWFKSTRITIDATGVRATSRWLIFSRTRQFAAAEVERFEIRVGMTSGTQTYQDLKLITRSGVDDFAARKTRHEQTGERPPLKFSVSSSRGVTLASSIASAAEANWLVQEMTKALGRRA